MIKSLENRNIPFVDDVRLTDRFYLGEPQMRGFDIRGIGPRVLRKYYVDTNGDGTLDTPSDSRKNTTDDALGGKYYYMARGELEIPLGSGARELGLRPSIFVDAGAVWGIKRPDTLDTTADGKFLPSRDANGVPQYRVTCNGTASTVPSDTTPALDSTCTGADDGVVALGNNYAFKEFYLGDTWKPRLAIGIGVNWNSPFGPFRIDFSKVILKREGDDTKAFTFNVGTQF